jgi:hypothetical protein
MALTTAGFPMFDCTDTAMAIGRRSAAISLSLRACDGPGTMGRTTSR